MNEELGLLQIPATVDKVETMAHGALRLKITTQENLSEEQRQKIMAFHEKLGWLFFGVQQIQAEQVLGLPELKVEENERSPASRYRSVLWVYWDRKKPTNTFAEFYERHYEKLITGVKESVL